MLKRIFSGIGFILLIALTGCEEEGIRLNQIQIIGTHNSYHLRPSKEILESPRGASLDYSHAPLRVQLEAGVRSFAIDIYQTEKDFRVLHIPVRDEGTNCETLKECLGEITKWSDQHPEHIPLIVFIEVKNLKQPIGDLVPADRDGMGRLEAMLWKQLTSKKLLTPDDVRGDETTLEFAILNKGWTLLELHPRKDINSPQRARSIAGLLYCHISIAERSSDVRQSRTWSTGSSRSSFK
jgi:hypothetical protein